MKVKVVTNKDYYTCLRCGNNSINKKGTMIPCPRGSCEAKISGTVIITTITTIDTNLTEEQKKWNKENYRE